MKHKTTIAEIAARQAKRARMRGRADKIAQNYNVQIACGPPRLEGETLAQYIERTSEPKPAGTVKQGSQAR